MQEVLNPNPCITYLVGHSPHWIQVKLARRCEKRPISGRLISVSGDGVFIIESTTLQLNLWNHNPDRLIRIAESFDGNVKYQPEFHIMWIAVARGEGPRYTFSVAKEGEFHTACRFHPPGTIFG